MTPRDMPLVGIFDICRANRRIGESLYETAERMLTVEAMERAAHHQALAAEALHTNPRVMNYRCMNLGMRPSDERTRNEARHG